MKNKFILCSIASLLFSMLLISCGNSSDLTSKNTDSKEITSDANESNVSDTTKNANNNTTEDNINSESSNATTKTENNTSTNSTVNSSSANTSESFYGKWGVKKVLGYSKVSANTDEAKIIGTKVSFSEKLATFDEESWDNPKYTIKNIKKGDFESDYRVEFSTLGIQNDSIMEVTVKGKNLNFQRIFLVKDNNTLIYCQEGVFFEIKRI